MNIFRALFVKQFPCHRQQGSMIIVVLIFGSILVMLFASLTGFILVQKKGATLFLTQERSLQIAEAGAEYVRWHLAHYPDDMQDGTGVPGPYVHTYTDPETGAVGSFSLQIGGQAQCGKVLVVEATSTGWTNDDPTTKRSVYVRIARPTVADYSYVVDSDVYAGSDRTIIGPYHSNGGIHMEGHNMSVVTSKVNTWKCTPSFGCSTTATVSGVYGGGNSDPTLFKYPVPDIDFSTFSGNLDDMQAVAVSSGIYLPKVSNGSNAFGYHLVLRGDGKVDIYKVTKVTNTLSTTPANQDITFPEVIGAWSTSGGGKNQVAIASSTRVIPADCGLIYVEDNVWLDGTVKGKVSVIANKLGADTPDMFLDDNIYYNTNSTVDGLTAIAERNLLIPLRAPSDMTINGVFFAANGAYGRNSYDHTPSGWQRNSLTTKGTIVSKLRTATKWTGNPWQGFNTRYDYYDRNLAKNPPPLTPVTSQDFKYLEWRVVQ